VLPIIKLDPLPYKIPQYFIRAFKLGFGSSNWQGYCINSQKIPESTIKFTSDATSSLQELNKEFYLFAGKWKSHMETLDIDTLRKTIIENTTCINDLKEKNKALEQQTIILQNELQEQKTMLEKEKAELLLLKNYKEDIIKCIKENYSMYAMRT
jgi:hypothetical protein